MLSEETIQAWHGGMIPANSKVSMEALEIVKGKAAVFVNWMKNAEIEGSSSDSEDSDDSDSDSD